MKNKFNVADATLVQEKLRDVGMVRNSYSGYPGQKPQPDLAWMRTLANGSKAFVAAVDCLCYSCEHIGTFTVGIKASKDVDDIMDYSVIKQEIEKVEDALEKDLAHTGFHDG